MTAQEALQASLAAQQPAQILTNFMNRIYEAVQKAIDEGEIWTLVLITGKSPDLISQVTQQLLTDGYTLNFLLANEDSEEPQLYFQISWGN